MESTLAIAARPPVVYADVRVVAPQSYEHLAIRNGLPSAVTRSESGGIGVRVRTPRAWGFAAVSGLTRADARSAAESARRVARASDRTAKRSLRIAESSPTPSGRYETPLREDPFAVELEEKIDLLREAERALHVKSAVKTGRSSLSIWKDHKWFGSSDGGRYESSITHLGAGVEATAVSGSHVERRSSPTSFGGNFQQGGFEFVRGLGLSEAAPGVGREAAQLLTAPACPEGSTTVVLASDQLALQIHESVGHATELDRILAWEVGFAGGSWVSAGSVGKLRYGSSLMNVVADATEPRGLGTFGWDDEGVPARRAPLITRGRLTGFQSSRETATAVGESSSSGAARAGGFHRMPLIRMTNVNLLPGDRSEEELLEGIDDGVLLQTNRSWSIDDKRLNFQFGTEIGWKIRHGEKAEMIRQPIYSGMTPEFWAAMDAVGGAETWKLWGVPNCGKGQPGQVVRVGHGAPMARFRNVAVRGGS